MVSVGTPTTEPTAETMNLNETLRDWITENQADFESLDGVDILTMGETGELEPPFVGIYEASSAPFEQGDVTLYGVATYEMTVELHTVPATADEEGTPTALEQQMRKDLHDIIADRLSIAYVDGLNDWQVFDIRASAPTTAAEEGRRVSRWNLTIVAAPL